MVDRQSKNPVIMHLLAFALVLGTAARADADDARDLVHRVLDETVRKSAAARLTLSSGSESREFELLRRRSGSGDQVSIRVTAPYHFKGTRYLFLEEANGRQDHYTFLPALRRTARIAADSLNQPFLATEFYVVDMIKPKLDDFAYRFVGDETVAGRACKLVESVPANGSDALYGRTVLAIDAADLVVVRTQFFDRQGRPLKVWTVERLEKVDDMWTPREQTMKSADGTEWRLKIEEIRYGVDLRDDEFAVKGLDG